MNKAILLQSSSESWEGLFVNDKLVEEGHTLNQGYSRIKYFRDLAKKYEFSLDDLEEYTVTDEYDERLCDRGGFDKNLSEVDYDPVENE